MRLQSDLIGMDLGNVLDLVATARVFVITLLQCDSDWLLFGSGAGVVRSSYVESSEEEDGSVSHHRSRSFVPGNR